MKILPDGRVQITNKQTGETRVVAANELSKYGLSAPAPQQGMTTQTAPFAQKPVAPAPDTVTSATPVNGGGFLDNLNSGIVNTGKNIAQAFLKPAQMLGKSLGVASTDGMVQEGNDNLSKQAELMSKQAIQFADRGDKAKATKLFKLAKDTQALAAKGANDQSASLEAESGGQLTGDITTDLPTFAKGNYAKGAVGTVGEVAAPFLGGGIVNGAVVGAMQGYSGSEKGQELSGAVKGAEVGGALGAAGRVVGGVAKRLARPAAAAAEEGAPNLLQKTGRALQDDVAPIRMRPSVYGASEEKAIKQTLLDHGITGNAAQQYEKLQSVMSDLGDRIDESVARNPKFVSRDQVVHDFMENLRGTIRTGDLTKDAAQKEVNSYINSLYEDAGKGTITDKVSTRDLIDLKMMINKDFDGVAKKLYSGASLTPREKVMAQARQTLDDVIANAHPDVKEMTVQQSHLYDAAPSLAKARDAVPTTRIAGTTIPKVAVPALQTAEDATGRVIEKVGGGIQGVGNAAQKGASMVAPIATSPVTQSVIPAVGVDASLEAQQAGNPGDEQQQSVPSQNEQSGQPDANDQNIHDQSLSPAGQSASATFTGYTPEEHAAAYQAAQAKGDVAAMKQIEADYKREVAYQKEQNPAQKPQSAQTAKMKALVSSGRRGVEETFKLLGLTDAKGNIDPNKNPDMSVLTKSIFAPGKIATRQYENAATRAAEGILRLRSGAVLSQQELQRQAEVMMPWFGDDPATVKYKLEQLAKDYEDFGYYDNVQDSAPAAEALPQ